MLYQNTYELESQILTESQADCTKILEYSAKLATHYNLWEDNKNIQDMLDVKTNSLCIFIKSCNPHLDEINVKSMALAFLLVFYSSVCRLFNVEFVQK